jgi:DNA-binding MurR/RpiR family transcriptional regulator
MQHYGMSRGDITNAIQQTSAPEAHLLKIFAGHRLTPTQRRIAQCLVENAATAPFLSASELAELTGVSQPSVTRFAIALGYSGFPALKRRLRQLHVSESLSETDDHDPVSNEYQRAVAAEIANLEGLRAGLSDPSAIRKAAELLTSSHPLTILGPRVSAPLAHYLAFFAAKFHPDVRIAATEDHLEQARAAGGTAVLAVALPRYPTETIGLLRRCNDLGFTVVTLTDSAMGPTAAFTDVLLPAAVGTDLVFDSQAAPMVLAVILLQAMFDIAPYAADRLEAFEISAERRHLFVP